MAIKLPPYVIWRDGRPRFIPDEPTRALGFAGQDLKTAAGEWMTYEAAAAWGWPRYAEILRCRGFDADQVRALVTMRKAGQWKVMAPAGKPKHWKDPAAIVTRDNAPKQRIVETLLEDWLRALNHPRKGEKQLAPETLESYRKAADALIYQRETRSERKERRARERAAEILRQPVPERPRTVLAGKLVAAIGVPEFKAIYLDYKEERGHHMALGCMAALSAALTWGQADTFWRLGPNPRHSLELDRPEGRIEVYTAEEIAARIAAGDAIGMHSVGDATLLGVFMGQRQKDRLAMTPELLDERHHVRQSKGGVVVEIKEAPRLKQRLAQAAQRRRELAVRTGLRPKTIVVSERTGWSYDKTSYRHAFAEVTRATIHGVVSIDGKAAIADPAELGADFEHRMHNRLTWLCRPCPSVRGKTDQDLRDTCVTWLYRAGNDLQAIADVSGHGYKAVETIVKHYLARNRARADTAIDKLVDWMEREGMAV